MLEKNKEHDPEPTATKKKLKYLSQKILNVATIFALLLPNIAGIGLVRAEELDSKDPQTEETTPAEVTEP